MTTYELTWDDDTPNYNAVTARSLNQIENELAKTLDISADHSWGEVSGSRSLDTTFTNNSGTHRFVLVSVDLTPESGLGASDDAIAEARLDPGGTNLLAGRVNSAAPANTTDTEPLVFFVQDGEDYRVNDASDPNGSAAIAYWAEFDFDQVYSPQTWSTGDEVLPSSGSPDIDVYTAGVNRSLDRTSAWTYVGDGLAGSVDSLSFLSTGINVGSATSGGELEVQIKDSGGSFETVAKIGTDRTLGTRDRMVFFFVNGDGDFQTANGSGSTGTFDEGGSAIFERHDSTTFSAGDEGATAENKWKTLDSNASNGWNTTVDLARTTHNSGDFPLTPSATDLSFVTFTFSVDPGGGDGEVTATVEGNTRARAAASSGGASADTMLMLAVQPGEEVDFTVSNNSSFVTAVEWTVQG